MQSEEILLRAILDVPKAAPKQPQYVLKHRTKTLLIDTYEACYAKLCEEAFKNDGMTLTRKENKRA